MKPASRYRRKPFAPTSPRARRNVRTPAPAHIGQLAIRHRWLVLLASFAILAAGGFFANSLKKQFFPKDLSYLAYIDIFLPEDAPFNLANRTGQQVENIVQQVSAEEKRPLESLSTFVGGGGPRFWYSLSPEPHHPNYAQIVLLFKDKHDTGHLLPRLQERLSREVAGARIDVRQLETGDAVGLPVAIRVSGEKIEALRAAADRVRAILKANPKAARVRDDWGRTGSMWNSPLTPTAPTSLE
ncbi:MAG: hypothetical protein DMG05_05915 [Acidobacteria bacterium]|nr:MAG: hypothetical protein DMG05_05915 [Acidobacteriota bacterium]